MAWLNDQIETRRIADDARFQYAMESLCVSVTGDDQHRTAGAVHMAQTAISKILAYYGATAATPLKGETSIYKLLDHHLASTGIMYREVTLPKDWYKDAIGCLLGLRTDGTPIALIPISGGYFYLDPETGKRQRVTRETMSNVLTSTAFCFYKPLPSTKLTVRDLLFYMINILDRRDYIYTILAVLFATLLGMLLPALNKFIYGPVLEADNINLVLPIGIMLLSVTIAQLLINTVRSVIMAQVDTKLSVNIQAAMMMRILSLPASFFKEHSSGELANRYSSATVVVSNLEQLLLGSSLTSIFSLIYIGQLMMFSPLMIIPALITILATCIVNLAVAFLTLKKTQDILESSNEVNDLNLSLINAIQKIKLAGAEQRVFSIWAEKYAHNTDLQYGHPGILVVSAPLTLFVSTAGLVLIYYFAIAGGVATVADYMAFTSIYGMVTGAFTSLNSSLIQLFSIKPHLKQLEPILQEMPETGMNKRRVENVRGGISLQNVTFSYTEGSRPLFEGLNLNIKPGEHVALVGKTGCGKSTIMRLMLGFEKPSVGSVFYDNVDLAQLDTDSLRSNIGVVLQNSTLLQGSIFQNIAIASPDLTMERAWEVAEMAGIADDIRKMPMKMMTMVSEGGGGISGGQRQRIIIARALATNPKILMFDEATSALDNISQKQVAESLDGLRCTRIVVAHRLSTIRHCDRIIVIDGGKVAQEGTFEELMAQEGLFRELAERQQA